MPLPASGPPTSPDVLRQQLPPMAQYAQQGQELLGGASANGQPSAEPSEYAKSELDKIAASLMNVAKVIGQTKPELMPLVQKMAEAGSMLSNELQAQNPETGAPAGPPSAETPAAAEAPKDMALGQ